MPYSLSAQCANSNEERLTFKGWGNYSLIFRKLVGKCTFLWRAAIIANQPKWKTSESIVKEIPYPENTDIFLLPLFWFISQITVSWMSVMGWKKISCQSSEGGSHLFIRSTNSSNHNYLSTFWPCLPIDCPSTLIERDCLSWTSWNQLHIAWNIVCAFFTFE